MRASHRSGVDETHSTHVYNVCRVRMQGSELDEAEEMLILNTEWEPCALHGLVTVLCRIFCEARFSPSPSFGDYPRSEKEVSELFLKLARPQ